MSLAADALQYRRVRPIIADAMGERRHRRA